MAKGLDFETRASYQIVVEAIDNGLPPLSSSINFTVFVLDVNDNYPSFDNVPDEIFVLEVSFWESSFLHFTPSHNNYNV